MTAPMHSPPVSQAAQPSGAVAELFGGASVLSHPLATPLDAHEMILQGLPAAALKHLLGTLEVLDKTTSLEKAVGMSLRTFQRRRDEPSLPLSIEQSGRAWKFAEILARATAVFGTQTEAEGWLDRAALALDGRRPIDLLATPAGVEMVEDLLTRLEYGVYA